MNRIKKHNLQDYINRLKEEKAQVRKVTAKEIFKTILDVFKDVEYFDPLLDGIQNIAEEDYGIRIMQYGTEISIEVDE